MKKIHLFVLLFICFTLVGTAAKKVKMLPPPTPLVCFLPIITPLPETKITQAKGGISISVSPVEYSTTLEIKRTETEVQPPLFSFSSKKATRYVEIVTKPVAAIIPDNLRFKISINNLLPRVFRGAGAVFQFTAGGKVLPMGVENYSEFLDVIIPPRQQAEISIFGVSLSQMPAEKTTLGIFIYDVVTKVDQAGNILEKQNFEWFFDFSTEKKEGFGPPTLVERGWVR